MGTEQRLKELIVENCITLLTPEEITGDTDLINDLGYDSISVIRLITDLEHEFQFEFKDEYLRIQVISNYSQLRNYVLMEVGDTWPSRN